MAVLLLAQLLWDTGIAGRPQEHFYHNIGPENPAGDIVFDYRGFLKQAPKRGSTANGVFGSKIGGGYWHDFCQTTARHRRHEGAAAERGAGRVFLTICITIHLTRRNKVRQAVSH